MPRPDGMSYSTPVDPDRRWSTDPIPACVHGPGTWCTHCRDSATAKTRRRLGDLEAVVRAFVDCAVWPTEGRAVSHLHISVDRFRDALDRAAKLGITPGHD